MELSAPELALVASVTICYQPDMDALRRQLEGLHEQVHMRLVVSNSAHSTNLANLCKILGVHLVQLGTNRGIAHAQNTGITQAMQQGAHMVLLMDQDSEPQPGMVGRLVSALASNPQAAAAGPSTLDLRSQQATYFLVDTDKRPRAWVPPTNGARNPVEVSYLIASGCLFKVSALADIGLMRADWFIDHIDTEWGLRARSKGWTILGVADAQLGHRLGEKMSRIWWLRERQVPHHSPLRHYYMFRNTILLIREPFVPWHWKRHHAMRLAKLGGFFLALAPQRGPRLRMMLQGLWDGLRGRSGAKT